MTKIRRVLPRWFNTRAFVRSVLHEMEGEHDVLVFPVIHQVDQVLGYSRLRYYDGPVWRMTSDVEGFPKHSFNLKTRELWEAFGIVEQSESSARAQARRLGVDAYASGLFIRDRQYLTFAGPVTGGTKWRKGVSIYVDEFIRDSVFTFTRHAV